MKSQLSVLAAALLGISTANAAVTYDEKLFRADAAALPTLTVTFSGECKGKVTVPVTGFDYSTWYNVDGGKVQLDSLGSSGSVYVNDQSTPPVKEHILMFDNYVGSPEDKFTQSLKKDLFKFNTVTKSRNAHIHLDMIDTSSVTCKSGTLQSHLVYYTDTSTTPPTEYAYDLELNGESTTYKDSFNLSHQNAVVVQPAPPQAPANPIPALPVPGEYKLTGSFSGVIYQPGTCTTKGETSVDSTEYSLTCAQPSKISVKVQLKGKGANNQVLPDIQPVP